MIYIGIDLAGVEARPTGFCILDRKMKTSTSILYSDKEIVEKVLERDAEKKVLPFCQKENISILAYGPLARGLLTGRFSDEHRIPDDDWRIGDWFFEGESFMKGLDMVSVLNKIGSHYGKTAGQGDQLQ